MRTYIALLDKAAPRIGRKWKLAGIAAGMSLLCAAGVIFFGRRAAPVLTAKDTIVLAQFANSTGDPAFEETLRPALAAELRQSPLLSLISEERIQHVLRLMAKPPGTPLTAETAREICERTGSAAMLDGSITRSGKGYVLLLRAQNCRTGELLYAGQAQAAQKQDVFRAIDQLASKFRKRAGESLTTIAQHSVWLSEATTPSLEAWRSAQPSQFVAGGGPKQLRGLVRVCSVGFVGSLYPIYVRGAAYLAQHRGTEAAAEFQKILDNRGHCRFQSNCGAGPLAKG